jgi:hypothetical protein
MRLSSAEPRFERQLGLVAVIRDVVRWHPPTLLSMSWPPALTVERIIGSVVGNRWLWRVRTDSDSF